MEIRNWMVKDVYFDEEDRQKAEKLIDKWIDAGWRKESEDSGGTFEICVQLMNDGRNYYK